MSLRIGIDARPFQSQRRGVGQYLYYLLKHLARIDRENQYVLFYNYFWSLEGFRPFTCDNPNFSDRVFRCPTHLLDLFWKRIGFPKVDRFIGEVDVFHEALLHLLPSCKGSVVVTLHDFVPLYFPDYYSRRYRAVYGQSLKRVARSAQRIIAVSENTKQDVMKFCGVPAERISVVYHGVDPDFRPVADRGHLDRALRPRKLDGKYILYVGGANRHKNLPTLLAAYQALDRELRSEYTLAFAGSLSWDYERLLEEAARRGIAERVQCIGYVSDEELPCVYAGAALVVFPSLYEGFGFVPLEAMACGTPVVCSNTSSLPEVVGDAGRLVNPHDTAQLREAMTAVLTDDGLRRAMIEKGRQRALTFSWERTARQTVEVYRLAAARS